MGAFGVVLSTLHFVGLYVQLSTASNPGGDVEVDNHISGNALFTEVPHDMVTESGQDVEMACSFRGAGSPSVSLEIQWWYIRNHREWTEKASWSNNQVVPVEEMVKDATKISVVKVAGSNISHKLRLSNVKTTDEGTYECRVIDFSDSHAQHHRVRAYLQVQPPGERRSQEKTSANGHHPHDHQGAGIQDEQLHLDEQLHPHPHQHQHPGDQQLQQHQQLHRDNHHDNRHKEKPHHDHEHDHPAHAAGDQKKQQQQHHGDQALHHGNQKQHHGDQAPHHLNQQQHHHGDDQAHKDDQPLHVHPGNHHKKEEREEGEETRKQPTHKHQSDEAEMKRRSVEGESDCTSDECGH
ncbi:V-set and transmembrane domain-containing protein 2-like protein [Engraulis encrasicolus]|uniref:V-set and transmembrane domain-containing protein 2-like protein n=1 Tax=Engraulis encrasicolus TaxID=184585 RepID=UPI002FD746D4